MYRRILVPLDGSKRAERILPHVENLAAGKQTALVFITVVRAPEIISYEAASLAGFADRMTALQEGAEEYLKGLKGSFREKGIAVITRVAVGPVVEKILAAAEVEKVDLVALASHGRTGLKRVFYGSVAAGILNRIDRPLLIIRSE